jgi:hypothetical protein
VGLFIPGGDNAKTTEGRKAIAMAVLCSSTGAVLFTSPVASLSSKFNLRYLSESIVTGGETGDAEQGGHRRRLSGAAGKGRSRSIGTEIDSHSPTSQRNARNQTEDCNSVKRVPRSYNRRNV